MAGTPAGKRLYQETGCPAHGMYPLYKIMWLHENRPEVFRRAGRYVSAKEYVGFRLTGAWQVDYSLAAGSGFLNTHTLGWSDTALDLAGIRKDQLCPLAPPVAVPGKLQPEVAAQMGVAAGTPVVMGSSDAVNSSIGAGAVAPTQATLTGLYRSLTGAFDQIARPQLELKPDRVLKKRTEMDTEELVKSGISIQGLS